jgi:hypothetical protein
LDSAEGGSFFFDPLQLHLEAPDLLEQLGLAGLGVGRSRLGLGRPGEEPLDAGQERFLPAMDGRGVDAVLTRQLVDGLVGLVSGQCDLGLERSRVNLPLLRHRFPPCAGTSD